MCASGISFLFFLLTLGSVFGLEPIYVPLGENVQLKCPVFEDVQRHKYELERVVWKYVGYGSDEDLGRDPVNSRFYVDLDDYSLTIYDIQETDEGQFSCVVSHVVRENGQDFSKTELSTHSIVVQNCGSMEQQDVPVNMLDPCQYGTCQVDSMHTLGGIVMKRLTCRCSEQYTGKYCDVQVKGTWLRELLFYSPIVGHFVITGLFFMLIKVYTSSKADERITLTDDVPDYGGQQRPPAEVLYPAAVYPITAEELALPSESAPNMEKFVIQMHRKCCSAEDARL